MRFLQGIDRLRTAVSTVVAAALLCLTLASVAQADFSDYGIESASASVSTSQAGDHPDVRLDFRLKTDPASTPTPGGLHKPYARTRYVSIDLPPGLIGNPNAVPSCSMNQFFAFLDGSGGCSQDSQVGLNLITSTATSARDTLSAPVYNMETPQDGVVARLGFYTASFPFFINIKVRSGSDYGLTATIEGPPAIGLVGVTTNLWGVPADSSHDRQRLTPFEAFYESKDESPTRPSGLERIPFMTNPTSCEGPLTFSVKAASYALPGDLKEFTAPYPETTGCSKVEFDPVFSVTPTSRQAAAPTGLEATLTIPQNQTPDGLATSQLRAATVELPPGMAISPSAADGLVACSAGQVHYGEEVAAECPEASKIGTVELDVPALSRRMHGALYQRTPEPGRLFRFWLVSDELGVNVKIPAEIRTDPNTGQITSVFVDTPRVPVRELELRFKSGSHGVLVNPPRCGRYETRYELAPWSGRPPVTGTTPMTVDEGCATGGFDPNLRAGTVSPSAGGFSPFTLSLTRADGEQNVVALEATLPPGLLAKLGGVPLCPASGDCAAASQVGTATVAVGSGPTPLWLPQPGRAPTAVYLSGPYKGAPYSLVIKVPAQAGPFDLGTVVTRAGIHVNPVTTQVTVKSDPLPQILEGVPISYRTIQVETNHPSFTLNPTSCDPMRIDARVTGSGGAVAKPSTRFQVGNCARLGFSPKVSLRLKGGTKRGSYPALKAVVKAKKGHANIAKISVALPRSEFFAQEHIETVCTRVQFAADACPRGSIYGFAEATTPLLDERLRGPVYLRSSSHPLPDLVARLRGPIEVNLSGRIDSVNNGLRATFGAVPDAPISRFLLKMKGGKKGLLVNSRNLCASRNFAKVKIEGQNGKTADQSPRLRSSCGKN